MRISTKRAMTTLGAAIVTLGILLGFPATGDAQTVQPVTLAIGYVPNVQFTPLYVGIAKGFYRDARIDLKIDYGFQIDIFSLLRAGKIDLGLSDGDQLIVAGSKDMGLVSVYQFYQGYPIAIVAKKGVVDTPAEFTGKTIGVPEVFGTSYIGLQLFLKHFKLEGKVKIQKTGYTQIPALLSGRIDGAVVFTTNEVVKLHQMKVAFNEWDVEDFSNVVGSSFISSKEIVSKRGPVLSKFFAATSRAAAYTAAHPDEAVAITMKYTNESAAGQKPFLSSALEATMRLFASPHGFGYISTENYQDSIGILVNLGLIPNSYDSKKILLPLGPAN